MEVSDQLHATAALPRKNNQQYPLDVGQGGPLRGSACYGKYENHLPLPGIEPLISRSSGP
jgi:hypothetical protein